MHCETCGREVLRPATGRPRRFCSDACRQAAYRRRQAAQAPAEDRPRHEVGDSLLRAITILENADGRSPEDRETALRLARKLRDQLEARVTKLG